MPCVVDYGELCLRDGVVGSAVVQVETAWDELAAAGEFVGMVEDLGLEEALGMDVSMVWQGLEEIFAYHGR